MQVNIIGNYFGIDGFSNHTRQLAVAMDKIKELDISMTCNKPQGWEANVTDQELQIILRDPEKADVNLMIGQPQHWRLYSNENKPFIGFLIWEGDKIPAYWIECLQDINISQIWIPSKHVENAILNRIGLNQETKHTESFCDKIKIVPHGVDLSIFKPTETKKEKFTFLCNKGFRNLEDRGGTQYAIQAFLEEFTDKDNVELIIKVNPAYPIIDIQQSIQELKPKDKTNFTSIKFIIDAVPYEKMNEIYSLGDVFVAPSRAEAFHLGCLEAQACGLPVITSNFGGQTDFCDFDNGWIIGGELKEVTHELEYEGVSWLTPSIIELKKVMREAYGFRKDDLFKNMSNRCIEQSKQWTWDKSAEKAYANLSKLK